MAVDIHKLIATIRPDLYCEESARKEVEELVKTKGYLDAVDKAKPISTNFLDKDDAYYTPAIKASGLKNPIEKHQITYDAPGENLEPIYFWTLDYLQSSGYRDVDKLVDNFIASAGSGYFSEMGMKATKMQEEAMKMLGSANTVIKSILNILYDLKEFKTRLSYYKKTHSDKADEQRDAIISLKQIWMDTVDMKRGNTAIKAMAAQYQYVTLIDAFMAAKNSKAIEQLDLNERVKRILQSRISEFEQWLQASESELNKRYNIEKVYLRSQVASLQLYARWMKPYLEAAKKLEQRGKSGADLVTAFNTSLFELTLFAEGEYDPDKDVAVGDLPSVFKGKNKEPGYKPVVIVEYKFRTIPGRLQNQNYTFRGKIEATFTGYALKKDEIKILKEQLTKDELKDMINIVGETPNESLNEIKKDIDEFLKEDEIEKKKKDDDEKKKKDSDTNPFSALFGGFSIKDLFKSGKKEEKEKDLSKGIPKDDEFGKVMRSQSVFKARGDCSRLYSEFKKVQNMVG